ncbi:MAG: CocE/NonD family hydrolase [Bacteroidota bacterium]
MKKILLLCLLLSPLFVVAQNSTEVSVEMKDGIILKADLYAPNDLIKGPVILMRTPYQKEGMKPIAEYFSSKGYYVVVQNVRGKYGSGGEFVPFLRERTDGEATLDWLAEQPWNNGNIGLWGSSYLGYSALTLSASENTQVKSIFHMSGWLDGTEVNTQGGAFHQSLVIPWLIFEGQRLQKNVKKMDLEKLLTHTPTSEALPNMFFTLENGDSIHLSKLNINHDDFPFGNSKIPIFHYTGWYDFVLPGVLSVYEEFIKKSTGDQYLTIGPWYHNQAYGSDISVGEYELPKHAQTSLGVLLDESLAWFDHTLRGKGFSAPSVEYYVLFKDEWKSSSTWPPSGGVPKTMYLTDGSLTQNAQAPVSSNSFIYNPENPVPTWGGANFHFFMDVMGIKEQSTVESRADVLTFTSSSYKKDKTYAGPVQLELFYKSEGQATDFTAKLTVVDELSQSWNVSEGIIRIPKTQNSINKTTIALNDVAFEVKKGWKLRIQISSSNFPKFNRNPNTGIDPMDATTFIPVKQTIYHGKEYPTHITIYEVPQ